MRRLLPLLFATASLVLMAGCYETGELRVRSVGALSAGDSCSDFAKQVFIDAGYERLTSVSGADMFFSPRAHTNTGLSLLWGIAVSTGRRSIGNDPTERCVFELEAIALE